MSERRLAGDQAAQISFFGPEGCSLLKAAQLCQRSCVSSASVVNAVFPEYIREFTREIEISSADGCISVFSEPAAPLPVPPVLDFPHLMDIHGMTMDCSMSLLGVRPFYDFEQDEVIGYETDTLSMDSVVEETKLHSTVVPEFSMKLFSRVMQVFCEISYMGFKVRSSPKNYLPYRDMRSWCGKLAEMRLVDLKKASSLFSVHTHLLEMYFYTGTYNRHGLSGPRGSDLPVVFKLLLSCLVEPPKLEDQQPHTSYIAQSDLNNCGLTSPNQSIFTKVRESMGLITRDMFKVTWGKSVDVKELLVKPYTAISVNTYANLYPIYLPYTSTTQDEVDVYICPQEYNLQLRKLQVQDALPASHSIALTSVDEQILRMYESALEDTVTMDKLVCKVAPVEQQRSILKMNARPSGQLTTSLHYSSLLHTSYYNKNLQLSSLQLPSWSQIKQNELKSKLQCTGCRFLTPCFYTFPVHASSVVLTRWMSGLPLPSNDVNTKDTSFCGQLLHLLIQSVGSGITGIDIAMLFPGIRKKVITRDLGILNETNIITSQQISLDKQTSYRYHTVRGQCTQYDKFHVLLPMITSLDMDLISKIEPQVKLLKNEFMPPFATSTKITPRKLVAREKKAPKARRAREQRKESKGKKGGDMFNEYEDVYDTDDESNEEEDEEEFEDTDVEDDLELSDTEEELELSEDDLLPKKKKKQAFEPIETLPKAFKKMKKSISQDTEEIHLLPMVDPKKKTSSVAPKVRSILDFVDSSSKKSKKSGSSKKNVVDQMSQDDSSMQNSNLSVTLSGSTSMTDHQILPNKVDDITLELVPPPLEEEGMSGSDSSAIKKKKNDNMSDFEDDMISANPTSTMKEDCLETIVMSVDILPVSSPVISPSSSPQATRLPTRDVSVALVKDEYTPPSISTQESMVAPSLMQPNKSTEEENMFNTSIFEDASVPAPLLDSTFSTSCDGLPMALTPEDTPSHYYTDYFFENYIEYDQPPMDADTGIFISNKLVQNSIDIRDYTSMPSEEEAADRVKDLQPEICDMNAIDLSSAVFPKDLTSHHNLLLKIVTGFQGFIEFDQSRCIIQHQHILQLYTKLKTINTKNNNNTNHHTSCKCIGCDYLPPITPHQVFITMSLQIYLQLIGLQSFVIETNIDLLNTPLYKLPLEIQIVLTSKEQSMRATFMYKHLLRLLQQMKLLSTTVVPPMASVLGAHTCDIARIYNEDSSFQSTLPTRPRVYTGTSAYQSHFGDVMNRKTISEFCMPSLLDNTYMEYLPNESSVFSKYACKRVDKLARYGKDKGCILLPTQHLVMDGILYNLGTPLPEKVMDVADPVYMSQVVEESTKYCSSEVIDLTCGMSMLEEQARYTRFQLGATAGNALLHQQHAIPQTSMLWRKELLTAHQRNGEAYRPNIHTVLGQSNRLVSLERLQDQSVPLNMAELGLTDRLLRLLRFLGEDMQRIREVVVSPTHPHANLLAIALDPSINWKEVSTYLHADTKLPNCLDFYQRLTGALHQTHGLDVKAWNSYSNEGTYNEASTSVDEELVKSITNYEPSECFDDVQQDCVRMRVLGTYSKHQIEIQTVLAPQLHHTITHFHTNTVCDHTQCMELYHMHYNTILYTPIDMITSCSHCQAQLLSRRILALACPYFNASQRIGFHSSSFGVISTRIAQLQAVACHPSLYTSLFYAASTSNHAGKFTLTSIRQACIALSDSKPHTSTSAYQQQCFTKFQLALQKTNQCTYTNTHSSPFTLALQSVGCQIPDQLRTPEMYLQFFKFQRYVWFFDKAMSWSERSNVYPCDNPSEYNEDTAFSKMSELVLQNRTVHVSKIEDEIYSYILCYSRSPPKSFGDDYTGVYTGLDEHRQIPSSVLHSQNQKHMIRGGNESKHDLTCVPVLYDTHTAAQKYPTKDKWKAAVKDTMTYKLLANSADILHMQKCGTCPKPSKVVGTTGAQWHQSAMIHNINEIFASVYDPNPTSPFIYDYIALANLRSPKGLSLGPSYYLSLHPVLSPQPGELVVTETSVNSIQVFTQYLQNKHIFAQIGPTGMYRALHTKRDIHTIPYYVLNANNVLDVTNTMVAFSKRFPHHVLPDHKCDIVAYTRVNAAVGDVKATSVASSQLVSLYGGVACKQVQTFIEFLQPEADSDQKATTSKEHRRPYVSHGISRTFRLQQVDQTAKIAHLNKNIETQMYASIATCLTYTAVLGVVNTQCFIAPSNIVTLKAEDSALHMAVPLFEMDPLTLLLATVRSYPQDKNSTMATINGIFQQQLGASNAILTDARLRHATRALRKVDVLSEKTEDRNQFSLLHKVLQPLLEFVAQDSYKPLGDIQQGLLGQMAMTHMPSQYNQLLGAYLACGNIKRMRVDPSVYKEEIQSLASLGPEEDKDTSTPTQAYENFDRVTYTPLEQKQMENGFSNSLKSIQFVPWTNRDVHNMDIDSIRVLGQKSAQFQKVIARSCKRQETDSAPHEILRQFIDQVNFKRITTYVRDNYWLREGICNGYRVQKAVFLVAELMKTNSDAQLKDASIQYLSVAAVAQAIVEGMDIMHNDNLHVKQEDEEKCNFMDACELVASLLTSDVLHPTNLSVRTQPQASTVLKLWELGRLEEIFLLPKTTYLAQFYETHNQDI